jgi:hypothetical protein
MSLRLNGSTEASQHFTDFIICLQQLEEKGGGHAAETKRQKFLDHVIAQECDVSKRLLAGAATTFDECVHGIRTQEQDLSKEVNEALKKAEEGSTFQGQELS